MSWHESLDLRRQLLDRRATSIAQSCPSCTPSALLRGHERQRNRCRYLHIETRTASRHVDLGTRHAGVAGSLILPLQQPPVVARRQKRELDRKPQPRIELKSRFLRHTATSSARRPS